MDLKLEILILLVDISRCSYQGAGNRLQIPQGAGQFIIQKLCADSLGILVSNVLFLCIYVFLFQKVHVVQHSRVHIYLTSLYCKFVLHWICILTYSCVTCSLFFSGTSTYNPPNYYTGRLSTMKGLIDHVDCIGTESKVIDCSHNINLQSYYTSPRLDCPECEHELIVLCKNTYQFLVYNFSYVSTVWYSLWLSLNSHNYSILRSTHLHVKLQYSMR